jgi:Zn-dependent oligopeptidase
MPSKGRKKEVNPLIDPGHTAYGFPNLKAIKPKHFLPALHHVGRTVRKDIKTLLQNVETPTHANLVDPLEHTVQKIDHVTDIFNFYADNISARKVKALSHKFLKYEDTLRKYIYSNPDIYRRIQSINSTDLCDEFRQQTKKHIQRFMQNGVHLPQERLNRLKIIDHRINFLGQKFSAHLASKSGLALTRANKGIALNILKLRQEKAKILGFDTYVDYVADGLTLNSRQEMAEHLEKYHKSLIDLKVQGTNIPSLNNEQVEQLKDYFPLDHVCDGVIRIAENFFDLRFVRTDRKFPVHHDPLPIYEVHDNKTGNIIGLLGIDLYCHEGETKTGISAYGLRQRHIDINDKTHIPITILCFEHGYPEEGQEILINPQDAIVIAHEMGHVLHSLMTTATRASISGMRTNNDISEIPSEFFEFLLWDRENIKRVSKHHKDGTPLNNDQADFIISTIVKNFVDERLEHCFLAILDHALHTHDPAKIIDLLEFENEILEGMGMEKITEKALNTTAHWHLFSSSSEYAGNMYSYTYSDMIAADLYKEYLSAQDAGPESATAFRTNLAKTFFALGGAKPAKDVIQLSLKRNPQPDAFKDLVQSFIKKGVADHTQTITPH